MDPLPRGMPGEASGDVCPMRGGTPGRPCRCCHRGEGLLMSVRVRDQQVGLGCSCGREARVGDPTGQGSGRECGSGGQSGGALWASLQLPCGRKLNKRKYLWGEWGYDQRVGSGAVLPAAATGGSQTLPAPLQSGQFGDSFLPIAHSCTLPATESLPLLLKDTGVVRSRGGSVAGTGPESFGALRATPDPRSSRRSWSTTRGLSLRKYLAQQPAGPPQTAVRGSVGTGRGSSVSVGAFPHRACLWKWFPISGLGASVCVSSCEGTG